MTFSLRVLCAVVGVIAGVVVLVKAVGNPALVATGVGLIVVSVGLVVP